MGSEMCIRDRGRRAREPAQARPSIATTERDHSRRHAATARRRGDADVVVARIDADFEVARIDGDEAKAGAILKTHESCCLIRFSLQLEVQGNDAAQGVLGLPRMVQT